MKKDKSIEYNENEYELDMSEHGDFEIDLSSINFNLKEIVFNRHNLLHYQERVSTCARIGSEKSKKGNNVKITYIYKTALEPSKGASVKEKSIWAV